MRTPRLVTICTACKREDVGVMLDWSYRDGDDKQLPGRYRMARHKVKFQARDKSVPYCTNGRSEVPVALVFERG